MFVLSINGFPYPLGSSKQTIRGLNAGPALERTASRRTGPGGLVFTRGHTSRNLGQAAQPRESRGRQLVFSQTPAPIPSGTAGHVHATLGAQVQEILHRRDR